MANLVGLSNVLVNENSVGSWRVYLGGFDMVKSLPLNKCTNPGPSFNYLNAEKSEIRSYNYLS